MLYPVILCLIAAGVILLLYQNAYILIEYVRKENDDNAVISLFTLGGILKLKYEVPFMDLTAGGIKTRLIKMKGRKEKAEEKEEEAFGVRQLIDRYRYLKEQGKHYSRVLKYIKSRLKLKEIKLDLLIGFEDAFLTGIVTGLAWSAAGIITSYISEKAAGAKKSVRIKSSYTANDFKVDLYCIFSIKIAHIIVVVFKLLFGWLKTLFAAKKTIGGDVSG